MSLRVIGTLSNITGHARMLRCFLQTLKRQKFWIATMKSSLALLATAAGVLSCEAFTVPSLSRTPSVRSTTIFSTVDESVEERSFAPDQVSRRTFTSTAAATLGVGIAGMVTAPGYAEAYQAPLDAQVKAIETANYIGQFNKKIYEPNSNGDPSKHLPKVAVSGNDISVEIPHVMTEEHYIKFIWLKDTKTNEVVVVKGLPPTDPSPANLKCAAPSGVTLRPYCFCNLHGLWKGEEFTVA